MDKTCYSTTFVKAMAAGGVLGLAGAASLFASSAITNASLALLVKSAIFPIGLILIVLSGFSLFTGCVATMTTMNAKDYFTSLLVVWLGNLLGAVTCAAVTQMVAPDFVKAGASAILNAKCYNMDIAKMLILGFSCNFLICLGITKSYEYKSFVAKLALLFITVFMFVICGFEHSIANQFYISFAMFCERTIQIDWLLWNLIPVTIGNFLGGWAVVIYDCYTH